MGAIARACNAPTYYISPVDFDGFVRGSTGFAGSYYPLPGDSYPVAKWILKNVPPQAWAIVDESDQWVSSSTRIRDPLLRTASIARNESMEISVLLAAKTPACMPPWFRSQIDVMIYHPWREEIYNKWLRNNGYKTEPPPRHTLWATAGGTTIAVPTDDAAPLFELAREAL